MEVYLLLAMFLLYMLTAVFLEDDVLYRMWLAAFVLMFAVTAGALSFWRFTNQEVMMNVVAVSWYYVLYLSLSVTVVLGVVNLWLFRRQVWHIFAGHHKNENQ